MKRVGLVILLAGFMMSCGSISKKDLGKKVVKPVEKSQSWYDRFDVQ